MVTKPPQQQQQQLQGGRKRRSSSPEEEEEEEEGKGPKQQERFSGECHHCGVVGHAVHKTQLIGAHAQHPAHRRAHLFMF